MPYKLQQVDHDRLVGVHPNLVRIHARYASMMDDTNDSRVGEGKRSVEKQRENIRNGASKSMRSRHIAEMNKCGLACAIDLWALADLNHDGVITGNEITWMESVYRPVADLMKEACVLEGFEDDYIQWGFDLWRWDCPHIQINPKYEPWA